METPFLRSALLSAGLLIAVACLAQAACDDGNNAVKEAPPDAAITPFDPGPVVDGGTRDGGVDGAPSDCFTTPTTHFEIINACTTAVKITKNPAPPKLLADGGLPPLN